MANLTGKGGFQKGVSGNPGGRAKVVQNLTVEARKYSLEAVRVLAKLMRTARSEQVRKAAADALLDRGFGRPVQALQIDGAFAGRKLTELSDVELIELEGRLTALGPDGQFTLFGGGLAEIANETGPKIIDVTPGIDPSTAA